MPETPGADLFGDVFRWHGRFLPPRRVGERLLLVDESGWLALGSPGVLALHEPLQLGLSLAHYCTTANTQAPLAQMLHALDALQRQGLVQPAARAGGATYLTPDFSAPPQHLRISAQADAIVLTAALQPGTALRWGQDLAAGAGATLPAAGLTVVFCDDYLDARLAGIDARQRAAGRPWMLVRPTGGQAMAGPLLPARQGGAAACWHCLAHRWRRNHPARARWQALQPGEDCAPPVRADAALVAARLPALLETALRMLACPDAAQAVWTLDSPQRHAVIARPQCPHCGAPQLMQQLQQARIAPARGQRANRSDGGWRTLPASATVERLAPHVSPLTGVIAREQPLNAETADGLTVYRSEIFRTAAPGSDPLEGAWTQLCLGKGISPVQARASALCEAVERYAAFYQGDEAVRIAPASQLDARHIPPSALACFSDSQKARLDTDRPPHAVLPRGDGAQPAWWVPAWSLTADARCYLPLSFCLAHAPAESQQHVTWTSNGCAAGNTAEEAILQGLLELVERDAAAIWWYGRIARPAIDLDSLPAESRQRLSHSCGPLWSYWLLDITHDFGIPVVVAVGRHQRTGDWAVGFGCSLDRALACERALTEMGQLIAAAKSFAVETTPAQQSPAFLLPLAETPPIRLSGVDTPGAAPASLYIADAIARCVDTARRLGLEVIVFDHSRPDIPLRTLKVVVPGLCHIWPELGNPRLREVPVALGWRDSALQESEFNPRALYV